MNMVWALNNREKNEVAEESNVKETKRKKEIDLHKLHILLQT